MRLNQSLLNSIEDLFAYIENGDECEELVEAMNFLRNILERDIDGYTNYSDSWIGFLVQSRLEEIWELLSMEERASNVHLRDYYFTFMDELEQISRKQKRQDLEVDEDDVEDDEEEDQWD
jgi:hypothetical protein